MLQSILERKCAAIWICNHNDVIIIHNHPAANLLKTSLVPRRSTPPVFDCLQYAKTEHTASDQKTGGVEGLGTKQAKDTIESNNIQRHIWHLHRK